MSDSGGAANGAPLRLRRLRLIKRIIRALQVLVAIALFLVVWLVSFRTSDDPAAAVPDTTTQFSLDLRVVDSANHGVVYAVEQRARPHYRILSFDTATGDVDTIFTVPEDAIVYGIALSPDREKLAVSYTPDFNLGGNGMWILDLDSGEFERLVDVQESRFLVDPVWDTNGNAVLVTHVDRDGDAEKLDVAELDVVDGELTTLVEHAVSPAVQGDNLYFLEVDDDTARRAIGHMSDDEPAATIEIGDGSHDLDHLLAGSAGTVVAVIEAIDDGSGVTIGSAADAHGNHDVPSTWWTLNAGGDDTDPTPSQIDPIIVYDAALLDDGAIVYATLEGLSVGAGDQRLDLVKSRALRFVAG